MNRQKRSEEVRELLGLGTSQFDDEKEYIEMVYMC